MHKRSIRAVCGTAALATGLLSGTGAMTAALAAPALPAVSVPCSTASLITAINAANLLSTPSVLDLAPNCTYVLTVVNNSSSSQGANGLPIITKNITLIGSSTAIARLSTAANFRILEVAGSGGTSASLTIQGIAIIGGHASGSSGLVNAGRGGCLLATFTGPTTTASTLHLQGSAVEECAAVLGGGIDAGNDASLTVTGSSVQDNTATGTGASGGGIGVNSGASAVLTQSSLKDNTAVSGTGGGLRNDGDATLKSDVVRGNQASQAGGGIYSAGHLFVGATFMVQNSTLLSGGAIFATSSASTHIAAGRFQLNSALVAGGAIGNDGHAFMQNSFITQNMAPLGGAIFEGPSASFAVFNSLIFGNTLNNCRPLGSVPFCVN